jgi:hypothetical protein
LTDDTIDNNVKQFSLNLVTPSADRDAELKDCLAKGLESFSVEVCKDGVKSFFAILLDDTDELVFVGAGELETLKTLGALRSAENELLKGL